MNLLDKNAPLINKNVPYSFLGFIWDNLPFVGLFLFALSLLVRFIVDYIKFKKYIKKDRERLNKEIKIRTEKEGEELFKDIATYDSNIFHFLYYFSHRIFIIILASTPLFATLYISHTDNFEYKEPANLIEIKDHIKINNDKLTIDSLPNKYSYGNREFLPNEKHDFKIIKDEFFSDHDIKLIDKDNNEYKIKHSEFNELQER